MAMIKKLSLLGVRSFSPADNRGQWIEFGSPLTLILGANGSGKTTIIEALKFAVTGQLPPNSAKGASFITDPKMTQTSKAQSKITLELEDVQGNRYTTSHKIQAQVKTQKGELSFSQLEGTLRVRTTNGETKEKSDKVVDIKYEMSRLMGVSEAVLSHVIFCHQEELCWPLDEGNKVKTTFDAIFNTLAYKECFDRLQTVDKELTTSIKAAADVLRLVSENRKKAREKQMELDNKKIELQQKKDIIFGLERDVQQTLKKLAEYEALEQNYAKKQGKVSEKRANVKNLEDQMKDLRDKIKEEFPGTIADLKGHIINFKQECVEKSNQYQKLEREHMKKDAEYKKLDQTKAEWIKYEGMLQLERNANKKNLELLDKRLLEIVTKLKKVKAQVGNEDLSTSFINFLNACDDEAGGSMSYESVVKTLSSALKMKENELQKVKEDFQKQENDLQAVIDDVRSRKASMEKEKEIKQQQLAESKKSHNEVKIRLKNLEGSTERLAQMDDEEEICVNQIEQIENSGFMVKCDSEIKSLTEEVKQLEEQVTKLSETVNVLVADKSKTDQITLLNRQKKQKQNECNEKMRLMEDDLKTVLEFDEIPKDGLLSVVESKIKSLTAELNTKREELKTNEKKLNTSKTELKYMSADLKKIESNLKDNRDKVADVLEDRDYNSVYEEVTKTLEEAQQNCYSTESAAFVYNKYIQMLNKKDCCPLCKRDQPKDLTKQLVNELEGDINRMKQNVPQLKEEVEKLKKRQQQVLKSKPAWDECHRLETDVIPTLKTRMAKLDKDVEKSTDENERMSMIVSEVEGNLQTILKCTTNVAVYESCQKEGKKLDESIAKMEKQRDPEARNSSMTLADAQAELQQLQTQIKNKRSEKEKKDEIRSKKRDELARLQEKKNKVKEEKLLITAELQNWEAMKQQKKELEVATKDIQAKIQELAQTLPTFKTEILKAEKNKTACGVRREEALKKLRDDKIELDKQKDFITELHKKNQEFEKKKGRFAEILQKLTECKEKLNSCSSQKGEIAQQMAVLKDELANQELRKRELEDNLSLKKKLEQVSKLKVVLKENEKILLQAENKGVLAQIRKLRTKYYMDDRKRVELTASWYQLSKTIKSLEKEVNEPMYRDAEHEYTQNVARKTISEKAQRDVRRYKTALDQAIMQFHNKKMEKINKILLEYWRRIYKGNDIDKIMIKTEADKDPAAAEKSKGKVSANTSTRKSYNYRVVMSRRGCDIDMRGRCSAGQRVLASIIIRIALAESFGARCGIITLDEPTTNLDQKNINSLADTLADLAEKMCSRKTFQLVVITHDQEFTKRLASADTVEKFWTVDRDKDGCSQITMVPKRGYGYCGAPA